jgi:hypothetical protein
MQRPELSLHFKKKGKNLKSDLLLIGVSKKREGVNSTTS